MGSDGVRPEEPAHSFLFFNRIGMCAGIGMGADRKSGEAYSRWWGRLGRILDPPDLDIDSTERSSWYSS